MNENLPLLLMISSIKKYFPFRHLDTRFFMSNLFISSSTCMYKFCPLKRPTQASICKVYNFKPTTAGSSNWEAQGSNESAQRA